MAQHQTKKVNKYRGHTTHGGGHRKKRRGAGSRGGRGNAGSGKRAGHRKVDNSAKRKGFFSHTKKEIKAINVDFFTIKNLDKLVSLGKVAKEGDVYSLDLKNLGYNKLLGKGTINIKVKVNVLEYTPKAADKIKAAGGEIVGQKADSPE